MENRTVAMNFEFSRQKSQLLKLTFFKAISGLFLTNIVQKVAKEATILESSQPNSPQI